jgi:glycosyltransferase involved in cell wall biosynthesis
MAASCDRIVRGLRRRGARVDVLVFTRDPGPEAPRVEARDGGGRDVFVAAGASPGTAAELGWSLLRPRGVGPAHEVVVGFGASFPGAVAAGYAAWLGLPSVVLVRGNDFDRDLFESRRGLWVRESLARATVVGAVSPEKVDRIKALFPGAEVVWTPNGIDAGSWALLPPDRERRDELRHALCGGGRRLVGVFGELKFKKRIPLLLGALRDAGLRERASLLAVGQLDAETTQLFADPALAPEHRHVPYTEREEMAGFYAACDFAAFPSAFEGMPNAMLEAMAAGAVPIASDAGAMPAVIEDGVTGFLFPAEDRAGAAAALRRAFALPAGELRKMAERARERVARDFSCERELDVIAGLLARRRGGARGRR